MVTSYAPPGTLRLIAGVTITVSPILNLRDGIGHPRCSNQAQEFLLLWSVASRDEKGSDVNIGDLSIAEGRGSYLILDREGGGIFWG